jgi:hypothetical protein
VERRALIEAEEAAENFKSSSLAHFVGNLEPKWAKKDVIEGRISSELGNVWLLPFVGGLNRGKRLAALAYISFVQLCRRLETIFHLAGCCFCAASIWARSRSSERGNSNVALSDE